MPKNHPEIWIGRVEQKLKDTDQAPWAEGISEISSPVISVGEGTDTEKNLIYIPTSDYEPTVFINNTTYPLVVEKYEDDTITVSLDKYQTAVTTISDDDAMGASYDVIDGATKGQTSAIKSNKYMKGIHAICPDTDSADTPIIKTSGADTGEGTGRKAMTRSDIIALKKKFDKMQCPKDGRRLVLCSDHVSDLLNNDQKFENQYYAYKQGTINDIFGFQIYEYNGNPYISSSTSQKLSWGAIPSDTDFEASVAFYAPNIAKKTGKTKQYFTDSKTDPKNQTNKLNYRHYFMMIPKRKKYIGAIMSAKI